MISESRSSRSKRRAVKCAEYPKTSRSSRPKTYKGRAVKCIEYPKKLWQLQPPDKKI